LKFMVYKP